MTGDGAQVVGSWTRWQHARTGLRTQGLGAATTAYLGLWRRVQVPGFHFFEAVENALGGTFSARRILVRHLRVVEVLIVGMGVQDRAVLSAAVLMPTKLPVARLVGTRCHRIWGIGRAALMGHDNGPIHDHVGRLGADRDALLLCLAYQYATAAELAELRASGRQPSKNMALLSEDVKVLMRLAGDPRIDALFEPLLARLGPLW